MDSETIKRVAKSAHISLTDEELVRYVKDLNDILDRFNTLDRSPEGEGSNVDPVEVWDVLREDESRMEFDPSELLKDMKTYENYIRGPRLK